jgi:hypothetical protein
MSDQEIEYIRQATEYEETAKRVTDPWVREKSWRSIAARGSGFREVRNLNL